MTPNDEEFDVCWHCLSCLEPAPAHCEHCPPPGECDVLGCDEPGCSGVSLAGPGDVELDTDELRAENRRLRKLLRRVIDDSNDAHSLRALARDIAIELGVPDPFADNPN